MVLVCHFDIAGCDGHDLEEEEEEEVGYLVQTTTLPLTKCRQCTYNVTLRRVRITIFAVKSQ